MNYGPERLVIDLRALGYTQVELIAGSDSSHYAIIPGYEIQLGRFAGRVIDLGIPATPNFPMSVGASIQVRSTPHLYDSTDNLLGVRNIQASPLGNEWRYWSKNFGWTEERSARRLMSQINEVFANA
jgi:hypothetical protein